MDFVLPVVYPVVSKRNVADGDIEEVLRIRCFFKPLDLDVRILVQLTGDAP